MTINDKCDKHVCQPGLGVFRALLGLTTAMPFQRITGALVVSAQHMHTIAIALTTSQDEGQR